MKKKINLSKDVINNYERTIEKLHRELEYFKIQSIMPNVKIPETTDIHNSFKNRPSKPHNGGNSNIEDQNAVAKFLKDIEVLNEIINDQSTEIGQIKFENDKLMNLYQNKEKLLNEKRDQFADIQSNYDELLKEKNYIEQQYLNLNENTNYGHTQDQSLLFSLVKSLQKERNIYKTKFKTAEKSLIHKNIEFYIIEEKEQIWKREREYYIKQQALVKAEVETSKDVIIRMENHINALNILLLPSDYIQRLSIVKMNEEYDSEVGNDSDSSYDDMMKGFGAVSGAKSEYVNKQEVTNNNISIPYINHLEYLESLKLIRNSKRKGLILQNKNVILVKQQRLDQQVITHLSKFFSKIFSQHIQDVANSQDNKFISILMQNGNLNGIDENKKLDILEEIVSHHNGIQEGTESQAALIRASIMSNEFEEMALQVQNYESTIKIKDQQLNTLSKLMVKGMSDSSVSLTDKDVVKFRKLDQNKLALELSRAQRFNSELDKINNQLQQRIRQQAELFSQLQDQQKGKFKRKNQNKYLYDETSEPWELIEKVANYISKENVILIITNKELMSEINAYKTFFSSKNDTLERTFSSSYQMLLSLQKQNEIMNFQLEKYKIKSEYVEQSQKVKERMRMEVELPQNDDESIFSEEFEYLSLGQEKKNKLTTQTRRIKDDK